ncbi:MAG: DUF3160 domain-containing protein [Clostridiales Family XIII bacterium]|nr:DUF3160 domain-containing protein [Clostridiales Family XIII bacterium]
MAAAAVAVTFIVADPFEWQGQKEPGGGSGTGAPARFNEEPQSGSAQYAALFADYETYTYEGTPSVPAYTIAGDLSNIENISQYTDFTNEWSVAMISEETKSLIAQNGFAVGGNADWREFFGVYEINRYMYAPSFVTTDSALHTFHLMFDYVLKDLEQNRLHGELAALSKDMVAASDAQASALAGTEFENAAKRNAAFFGVGARLLDSSAEVPAYAEDLVAQELALIEGAGGVATSPVMNVGEGLPDAEQFMQDYSQFIPRSHYNQSDELKAYFKAMIWYGQLTFRSNYEDEARSALLITSALQDEGRKAAWYRIFEPTNFFVGECDDITFYQYEQALADLYGGSLGDTSAVADAGQFEKAYALIKELPPPRINSVPSTGEGEGAAGFRFLGQRFTVDASVMQKLMEDETPGRVLPKALDIPAALGSKEAEAILTEEGDVGAYPQYTGNLEEARTYLAGIGEDTWHSNLYWSWIDTLRPLADDNGTEGLPLFMQNSAWARKELNTFEGSWTELKHDTLLYAKPPMAEAGGWGGMSAPPDDRGYVEPNPELFGRLASLVKMTQDGLEQRGLLTDAAKEGLGTLHTIAARLAEISEKELANAALTEEDYDFIREYGVELEHIWETAKQDELQGQGQHYLEDHPSAVIADVATGADGSVLEEATGFVKEIYVAFPRDGGVALGRGAVYSQYEFTVPMAERVTDEAWHARLNEGGEPGEAQWKRSFIADADEPYSWAQTS